MRLAVSGSHGSGKTTLIEALARPDYESIPEPYHQLLDAGHGFQNPPSGEDFEAQLELALGNLEASGPNTLFDRCPLDLLAYLRCQDEAFDLAPWLPRIRQAMARLDLIVYLPLAEDDPVASQDAAYRQAVDQALQALLLEDELDLDLRVIELSGTLPARINALMAGLSD